MTQRFASILSSLIVDENKSVNQTGNHNAVFSKLVARLVTLALNKTAPRRRSDEFLLPDYS